MDCIIPGSFDPITNGHLDLIKKASKIFDKVVVLISRNPQKTRKFSLEQSISFIEEAVKDLSLDNCSVDHTSGLVTDYWYGYGCIVRGIRDSKDYACEEELAKIYEALDSNRQVVWLRPNPEVSFISSSMARELIGHKKLDLLEKYVPASVFNFVKEVK